MKSFKQIMSEVAEPKSGDEKRFKDKHIIDKVDHPVALDHQFTGEVDGIGKAARIADHEKGEDEKVYEAMDPVNPKELKGKHAGRKDKDIDNDGDVDSSDEYLHNRRKAIAKAMKKEGNAFTKALYAAREAGDKTFMVAGKEYKCEDFDDDGNLKESYGTQAQRMSSPLQKIRQAKEKADRDSSGKLKSTAVRRGRSTMSRLSDIQNKANAMAAKPRKEEVEELDEISKDLAGRYIKKAQISTADAGRDTMDDRPHIRKRGINKIVNRRMGTADAIRKLTGKARVAATESVELDETYEQLVAEAYEFTESAWEEVPMMKRQLYFMAYAAEEIMEWLDSGVDPEEWFQNKMAAVHGNMRTLYAYVQGENQMMDAEADMFEETDLGEDVTKMSHGRLKFHMNNKHVPHGSYSWDQMKAERDRRLKTGQGEAYKKAKMSMSEAEELDEASPTKKTITRALQGMKVQPKDKVSLKKAPWEKNEDLDEVTQSAIKKPVTTTGPDGKTRTVYRSIKAVDRDERGQEKIKESVLNEAFKAGILKLNDGSSVIVKKQDADLLNKMMKDLRPNNRKSMTKTAMIDKAGFEEILGFAREAL